jgi:hypothetical protein
MSARTDRAMSYGSNYETAAVLEKPAAQVLPVMFIPVRGSLNLNL